MMLLVNLFIAAYLVIAICWHLPAWTFWRRLIAPCSGFVERFGFGQIWGMFAPDPSAAQHSLHVLLPRAGGGALRWEPPRAVPGSRWSAFVNFRRHLFWLMALSSRGAPVRRAVAAYLMRKYDFGADRPSHVLFVCTECRVAPPPAATFSPPSTFIFDTVVDEQQHDLAEYAG